jgi:hypothetical protein
VACRFSFDQRALELTRHLEAGEAVAVNSRSISSIDLTAGLQASEIIYRPSHQKPAAQIKEGEGRADEDLAARLRRAREARAGP